MVTSKPWSIHSETMSVILKENKLFKNYQKSGLETVTDLRQKGSPENYVKEKQTLFSKKKKKLKRMLIILWNF